ncbi:MAG: DUF2007 domain-containing protein [Verrucomicrobiaceae bacterium]|nr:MAG: DUF2007 domain-containing protein [Verrucomicrobiaceae bacterium]
MLSLQCAAGAMIWETAYHPVMIELLRQRDLTKISYYQSLLEAAGIPTFIRNENLSTTEGVSIPDFFPALCIVNDTDEAAAVQIMRGDMEQAEQAADGDVTCAKCSEVSPANFGSCWNCGTALEGMMA